MQSSPRTWGCFQCGRMFEVKRYVFPTHVGVFPWYSGIPPVSDCLPHARGGVSTTTNVATLSLESSPRTWGCFCTRMKRTTSGGVFPTHVGVFPVFHAPMVYPPRLPHARGGVSSFGHRRGSRPVSSPRTWGCFLSVTVRVEATYVFPTHVGVFPIDSHCTVSTACLPHARGGVSTNRTRHRRTYPSSPRTWGCFWCSVLQIRQAEVFPTHVGGQPLTKRDGWRGVSVPD